MAIEMKQILSKNKGKSYLFSAGIIILLSSSFVWNLAPLVLPPLGSPFRSEEKVFVEQFVSSILTAGAPHEIPYKRYEKWSYKFPEMIRLKKSEPFILNADIEFTYLPEDKRDLYNLLMHMQKEYGKDISDDLSDLYETNKLENLDESVTVSIEGPFKLFSVDSQTLPEGYHAPFKWEWLIAFNERDNQEIKVNLPFLKAPNNDKRVVNTKEGLEVIDRYIHIPVKVVGLFNLTSDQEKIAKIISWAIGLILTSPLILSILKKT